MSRTSAPTETPKTTGMNRKIYVRPEHEPTWQQAVELAKKKDTSLSEVVSLALRCLLDTDTNA